MGKSIAAFEDFKAALDARAGNIRAMLPSHVSIERFRAVALSAASQRSEILKCTPNTLFGALSKAAQDGLLPDGREGVILSHRSKHRHKDAHGVWREQWTDDAAWIPMVQGQRKRARELEGLLVQAEVIYERDHFLLVFGDEPRLEHTPAGLGVQRGEPIGAYAIYRIDGVIVHREVMDRDQILTVRSKSKNPEGMLWTTFWTEGWRKTVIKRGFKSVPVGEPLDRLLNRDNALFDLDGDAGTSSTSSSPPLPPLVGPRSQAAPLPPLVGEVAAPAVPVEEPEPAVPVVEEPAVPVEEPAAQAAEPRQPDTWLDEYDRANHDKTKDVSHR